VVVSPGGCGGRGGAAEESNDWTANGSGYVHRPRVTAYRYVCSRKDRDELGKGRCSGEIEHGRVAAGHYLLAEGALGLAPDAEETARVEALADNSRHLGEAGRGPSLVGVSGPHDKSYPRAG
jgi:hypothetical protein